LGWDSYIGNLANISISIVQPDNGDKGRYFVCTGPAGRQIEPLTESWHFYPIEPNYTFYELELAEGPAAVADASKKRAQYDMYYANRALRKLTYNDIAYAPLDEIYNQAATENQKGDYYLRIATLNDGNVSLSSYARAVRAFTRCQALANKVYESLVVPATTPTELGLQEWLGDWGEWGSVT